MARYRVKSTLQKVRGYYHVRSRVYDIEAKKVVKQCGRSTGYAIKDNYRRALAKIPEIEKTIIRELEELPENREPTFREYVKVWLDKKAQSTRANTMLGYKQYADSHILPVLGDMEIRTMTIRHIQTYYTGKAETLKSNSLKKQHCVIVGAFDEAVNDGIIQSNPCRTGRIDFPKDEKFSGKAYTPEQVIKLLQGAQKAGEPLNAAVILMACYGLRREECLGLRWKDVDFENNQIHVRNTVVRAGKEIIEAEQTKTAKSNRTITLIACTIPYLKGLMEQHKSRYKTLDKLVRWPDGRSVMPDYITRSVSKLMKECCLPHIRVHDLRHTAATILSSVATPKQVQEFMGHEDIGTTMNIYTHVHRKDRDETSALMGGILENTGFCSAFCSAMKKDNVHETA